MSDLSMTLRSGCQSYLVPLKPTDLLSFLNIIVLECMPFVLASIGLLANFSKRSLLNYTCMQHKDALGKMHALGKLLTERC